MMKHTLRCHGFGEGNEWPVSAFNRYGLKHEAAGQNRASPQGVAATIAASFVARLANMASIGCTSLRAIDDSDSQRTRVSSCHGL
jgi:hypothetical protein